MTSSNSLGELCFGCVGLIDGNNSVLSVTVPLTGTDCILRLRITQELFIKFKLIYFQNRTKSKAPLLHPYDNTQGSFLFAITRKTNKKQISCTRLQKLFIAFKIEPAQKSMDGFY